MRLRIILPILTLFGFLSSYSQRLFEGEINVSSQGAPEYQNAIIYLPANYTKDKAYPLVIFTHGMGEAGKNVKKLYKQGLPKVLKSGYRAPFDFIMVAVQRGSFSVPPDWLPGILQDCQKRWKIDASRIYLTGLSAGGWAIYGSQLNFSPSFAKKFAAIVINSGVTQNTNKNHFDWWKQTKTPLWAIVGGADKGYVEKNAYMVSEINKRVPGLASLTVRAGVGHGGWTEIYGGKIKLNGKNMWEWLYQFKRTDKDNEPDPVEQTPRPDPDETDNGSSNAKIRYIKVNIFRGVNPISKKDWNNWDIGAFAESNIRSEAFDFADGSSSSVHAVLSFSNRVVDNQDDYGGGMAPDEVIRYASYAKEDRTLTITGLSPSKQYAITFYASRRMRPGNSTLYRIDNASRTVATNNNHDERAVFSELRPDANGRIEIRIESLNTYNYINGFMIAEISPVSNQ